MVSCLLTMLFLIDGFFNLDVSCKKGNYEMVKRSSSNWLTNVS